MFNQVNPLMKINGHFLFLPPESIIVYNILYTKDLLSGPNHLLREIIPRKTLLTETYPVGLGVSLWNTRGLFLSFGLPLDL